MAFLILGENELGDAGSCRYRGTGRRRPPHGDGLPDQAEYNRLYDWYMEDGGESGVVHDLVKARRLAFLLRQELGRTEFELVEATRSSERPSVGGDLLGYDLSCAWSFSLLEWGLELGSRDEPGTSRPIQDLVRLVEAHFKPLLNEHGLFVDEQTAAFCLRSMLALQALSPGLWENEEASNFEVIAIFKVADAIGAT